jgi:multisubunit Na+/H+ antiporter MnhB subunit
MRKKNYIFTNKKHSNRAIMSTILGGISLVSLGIVTYLSYSQGGGVTGALATIYSLIGLILGILTLREKDIYRIFPVLGTVLNVVALGGVSFLLYLGSRL